MSQGSIPGPLLFSICVNNLHVQATKHMILATSLPLLGYGDLFFMNAPDNCLNKLDTVNHCTLHFITGCGNLLYNCSLYAAAKRPSLYVLRILNWLAFIHKSLLGLVPSYLWTYMRENRNQYGLRALSQYSTNVPQSQNKIRQNSF